MTYNNQPTRIEGLSDLRRMPRIAKIRLGVMVKNEKGSYPQDVDYFVCPENVTAVFGDKPKELRIMLPLNEIDLVFPQALKMYGANTGLKCSGDRHEAVYYDKKTDSMVTRKCPCEQMKSKENPRGSCTITGTLNFLIPEVNMGGIFQIVTHSFNSILDINSGIEYIRALLGRVALVPLLLRREEIKTYPNQELRVHHTLKIYPDFDRSRVDQIKAKNQEILQNITNFRLAVPQIADGSPQGVTDTEPIGTALAERVKQIKAPEEKAIADFKEVTNPAVNPSKETGPGASGPAPAPTGKKHVMSADSFDQAETDIMKELMSFKEKFQKTLGKKAGSDFFHHIVGRRPGELSPERRPGAIKYLKQKLHDLGMKDAKA